jgi:hypothetical protein
MLKDVFPAPSRKTLVWFALPPPETASGGASEANVKTVISDCRCGSGVTDPDFRAIDLICDLVRKAGDRAAIAGLGTIARRTRSR